MTFADLAHPLPEGLRVRVVVLDLGERRGVPDWGPALVFVERGALELELRDGGVRRVDAGEPLWLHELPVAALRGAGPRATVLVALTRLRGCARG